MGADGDDLELVIHDLTLGEGQSFTDLAHSCLHMQRFAGKGGARVILCKVQRDPLTPLLGIKRKNGERRGQISPSGMGTAMDASDAASVAVELPRVVVLEDDVADVRVALVLGSLLHIGAVNSINIIPVGNLYDIIWVELSLE